MRNVAEIVVALSLVAGSFLVGMIAGHAVIEDLPMPCAEHQVYVWTDYPNEAHCVSDTDHSQHTGVSG